MDLTSMYVYVLVLCIGDTRTYADRGTKQSDKRTSV